MPCFRWIWFWMRLFISAQIQRHSVMCWWKSSIMLSWEHGISLNWRKYGYCYKIHSCLGRLIAFSHHSVGAKASSLINISNCEAILPSWSVSRNICTNTIRQTRQGSFFWWSLLWNMWFIYNMDGNSLIYHWSRK